MQGFLTYASPVGTNVALLYNDRSILENHHLTTTFQILRKDECNILSNFTSEQYKSFREGMHVVYTSN